MNGFKRTKIVCTIGPASDDRETLGKMIDNGMDVCRLNFSHGTHEDHQKRIDTIKEIRRQKGVPVAILVDTRGPEIRTGDFEAKDIQLEVGQDFTITMDDIVGNKERCTVTYKELVKDISVGDRILIDDGLIEGHIQEGDLVVITAGVPVGKAGNTNLVRVHIAMKIIVQGIGVGNSKCSGKAQIVTPATSPQMFQKGNILVASTTNKDIMKMVVKASAIIIESDEITSDAAIAGLNLGLPVIVAAKDATTLIKDGDIVTVDAEFGRVYSGELSML